MTQWLAAIGMVALFLAAMPRILRWVKTSGGKGAVGGVAMALGMAFSVLLDPGKRAAMENVEDQKARGGAQAGRGEKIE